MVQPAITQRRASERSQKSCSAQFRLGLRTLSHATRKAPAFSHSHGSLTFFVHLPTGPSEHSGFGHDLQELSRNTAPRVPMLFSNYCLYCGDNVRMSCMFLLPSFVEQIFCGAYSGESLAALADQTHARSDKRCACMVVPCVSFLHGQGFKKTKVPTMNALLADKEKMDAFMNQARKGLQPRSG